MAKLSRNARKKARVRRNLSMANRSLKQLQQAYYNTQLTLLMVLAQNGGEIAVTQGTMQQVIPNIKNITWQNFPGANDKEFIVRLLVQELSSEAVESQTVELANGSSIAFEGKDTETPQGSTHSIAGESFPGSSELVEVESTTSDEAI